MKNNTFYECGFMWFLVVGGLLWCSDAFAWFSKKRYIPEVSYYSDGTKALQLGDEYTDKDECLKSAFSTFKEFNEDSPKRAISWACRVMEDGKFMERIR